MNNIHIFQVGNQKEERVLRKPCKTIVNKQSPDILVLMQKMKDVCLQPGVVGVAANQLGQNVKLFAIGQRGQQSNNIEIIYFFNPKITSMSKERDESVEGCLSIPDGGGNVSRATEVNLSWEDQKGKKFKYTFKGFGARAIQHEMRHLEGYLISDDADRFFTKEELISMSNKTTAEDIENAVSLEMGAEMEALKKSPTQ